ncbi:hypothetical protein [Candidatus Ichthyocystis sparus]|uniref:hypothetical protein n=1 Tax=Candidatus Ichthyocystis sparus TaxID=1561004 RepID=UPI000B89FF35|nr:hypothetical protein [Candidatus Ichthyocystis sparus]
MCNTNGKYLDCSKDCSLEFHTDNVEVSEEVSCTTIMLKQEVNYQKTNSFLPTKPLISSCIATPLVMLSMLEGANGSKASSRTLSSYLCVLEGALCDLIRLVKFGGMKNDTITNLLESAFMESANRLNNNTAFNFSIPIDLPTEFGNDDATGDRVIKQLSIMSEHISSNFNKIMKELLKRPALRTCRFNDGLCGAANSNFCYEDYNVNTMVPDTCCSSISSYINYKNTAPEILESKDTVSEIAQALIKKEIQAHSESHSESISSYLCDLEGALCGFITILRAGRMKLNTTAALIKSAFERSIEKSVSGISIPFNLDKIGGNDTKKITKQLSVMAHRVVSESNRIKTKLKKSGVNISMINDGYCDYDNGNFCYENHTVNNIILDKCCSDIRSYITYGNTMPVTTEVETASTTIVSDIFNSTTVEPTTFNLTEITSDVINSTIISSEIINSTVSSDVINSTTNVSPTLISEEITPNDNKLSTISIVVLVAFLSLAIALLTFLGYRSCKKTKTQQPQPVPQSDNVRVDEGGEAEDLV